MADTQRRAGPLEADASRELAHARPERGAKCLAEIGGVHPAGMRELGRRGRRAEFRLELVPDVVQPGGSADRPLDSSADRRNRELDQSALEREAGEPAICLAELRVDPARD